VTIEDDVAAAEGRLGVRLPPSYRAYLIRGADLPGDHGLKLLPLDEIDRFARREREWLDAWMEGVGSVPSAGPEIAPLPDDPTDPATMPAEELAETVVISTTDDMRVLLINPARIDGDGEWEAWDFATWYPGAYRYPSFDALITALAHER
jgi:hypothetical protein